MDSYLCALDTRIVRDHDTTLGFAPSPAETAGASAAMLDLRAFVPAATFIHISEGNTP